MNAELTIYLADGETKTHSVNRSEAIALFGSFPWENELEGIAKSESGEPVSFVFRSATNGELMIASFDNNHFEIVLRKDGKIGEEYMTSDLKQNTSGTSPEDFIAAYFDGDLHENMNMFDQQKENDPNPVVSYSFAQKSKIRFLLVPVILLAGWIFILVRNQSSQKSGQSGFVFITGFLFLASLPSLWFFFRYFRHDRGKTITLDKKSGTITIEQDSRLVSFSKKEIEACRIFSGRSSYRYVLFKLKNGKHFSVTNFVVEPFELITEARIQAEHFNDMIPTPVKDSEF